MKIKLIHIFRTLAEASCYFVIIRSILFIPRIIFFDFFNQLNYHYSDESSWYFIWFLLPLLTSLIIISKFKIPFFQQAGSLLFPLIIIGTIYIGKNNKDYWGYAYKRPSIFHEVKKTN